MTVYHPATAEEYQEIKSVVDALIVVDYSAVWCGPCKRMAPLFEKAADQYPQALFVHVDVDQLQVDDAAVNAVPTFKFFYNQECVAEFSGANSEKLFNTLAQLLPA